MPTIELTQSNEAAGDLGNAGAESVPDTRSWLRNPGADHLARTVYGVLKHYIPEPVERAQDIMLRKPRAIEEREALEQHVWGQAGHDDYVFHRIMTPVWVYEHLLLSLMLLRARKKALRRHVPIVGAETWEQERVTLERLLYGLKPRS